MSFLGTSLASFLTVPNEQGTTASGQKQYSLGQTGDIGPVNTAKQIIKGKTGAGSLFNIFFGWTGEQFVTVLIGVILIAAGVFMFKPVRETVVTAGKTAAKAAA